MSVRLFLGDFVGLAACATVAFASFGGDNSGAPSSFAAVPPYSNLPYSGLSYPALAYPGLALPAPAFHVHLHKALPKHVQIAQAE